MTPWFERVRLIRRRHSLTQQQLADFIGCCLYTVRGWEQGRYEPTIKAFVRALERLEAQSPPARPDGAETPRIAPAKAGQSRPGRHD